MSECGSAANHMSLHTFLCMSALAGQFIVERSFKQQGPECITSLRLVTVLPHGKDGQIEWVLHVQ